jgi:membrane associated rhomboid family serine protease
MIPIKDENPTELTPVVTLLFIAVNAAAWFLVQGAGTEQALQASVTTFGAVPCEVTARCAVEGLSWAGVVTSMFMHGSWEHIIGNMLFLWVFGNNIEDSMGHVRFFVFYVLCGVAAALAHVYFNAGSEIPTVGASGAISGIMGAYILLYPNARVRTWVPPFFFLNLRAIFFLGYWFILQLGMAAAEAGAAEGEQSGVAVMAHLGGFVVGLALVKVFENRALTEARRRKVVLTQEELARTHPWL